MQHHTARALSDLERLDWLRLARSEQVGPVTFRQLLERFGSAAAALRALPDLARRGGRQGPLRIPSRATAEQELAALHAAGAGLVCRGEPDYPPALAAIDDAPAVLTFKGHAHLGCRPCVAMVGARNASAAASRFARDLAAGLGEAGYTVVSGLARGIDAAAHAGALDGGTAAVLGGGIDVVYPPEHADLQRRIGDSGLLLAEMPPGTVPQARHFPRRNRLISGMSLGVVVVEAALRSGSLITARMALEQGRELFAVPGSPLDPRARGSNDLLRQGATLVEGVDDVLRELHAMRPPLAAPPARPPGPPPRPPDEAAIAAARQRVSAKLTYAPVAVDELIRQCALPPAAVLIALLELELAGRIERHAGNRVSLA